GPVIRFGHAQQVASLAAERIAAYHGKLRYHLFITDFIFEAVDLAELVTVPGMGAVSESAPPWAARVRDAATGS
ncbi:hypothetical protein AB0L17_34065, partial [Streptomyces cellulosae]